MQSISASQAKQNFGELLTRVAEGPVAVERHGKVEAVVCSPAVWARVQALADPLVDRQRARLAQDLVEKDRLIRHQKIALSLLGSSPRVAEKMIAQAQAVVARWKQERLCSQDYIVRWSKLLSLPRAQLALALTDEHEGWGRALRQNSS